MIFFNDISLLLWFGNTSFLWLSIPQIIQLGPLHPLPLLLPPVHEPLLQNPQRLHHRTVQLHLPLHVISVQYVLQVNRRIQPLVLPPQHNSANHVQSLVQRIVHPALVQHLELHGVSDAERHVPHGGFGRLAPRDGLRLQFVIQLARPLARIFKFGFGFVIVSDVMEEGHVLGQHSRVVSDFGRVEDVSRGCFGGLAFVSFVVGGEASEGGMGSFVELIGTPGTGIIGGGDEGFGGGDFIGGGGFEVGGDGGDGG
mmetsp:Transcript_26081/g.54419  ORF Transcript_26081/g.54419 Transcript_26081/m.54419 type:complete len:255 (+) Transcript_26081:81-845(+)